MITEETVKHILWVTYKFIHQNRNKFEDVTLFYKLGQVDYDVVIKVVKEATANIKTKVDQPDNILKTEKDIIQATINEAKRIISKSFKQVAS